MKRFLVIGLGRFGMSLAETLFSEGAEVIAVDSRPDRIDEIKEKVSYAVQLESTDPDALKSVGADRVDVAIVAIGEDFEASVVTTAILKELGLKKIIVRAYTERERKILHLVGASRVIFVENEMGRRFGKTFCGNDIVDHIALSSTHSIVQWEIPEEWSGKSPGDLQLSQSGLMLLAVKRSESAPTGLNWSGEGEQLAFHPPDEYRLMKGDLLVLAGKNNALSRFTERKKGAAGEP
jgi:trk system potassium uptake protein TrkA